MLEDGPRLLAARGARRDRPDRAGARGGAGARRRRRRHRAAAAARSSRCRRATGWRRTGSVSRRSASAASTSARPATRAPPPPGLIALRVEAATAFGSGRHASTAGCLQVLGALAASGQRFARPLDLGCGSGILAIAAAKLWRVPVLASDVDANAVAVTPPQRPAERRGAAGPGAWWPTAGAHRSMRAQAPFDLVLANILARPLKRMARRPRPSPGARRHGGAGGLPRDDGTDVLAAHRAHGLRLVRAIDDATGWRTLVLRRPESLTARLALLQMLGEPRHQLDEVARPVPDVELVDQDVVPGVACRRWASRAGRTGRCRGRPPPAPGSAPSRCRSCCS